MIAHLLAALATLPPTAQIAVLIGAPIVLIFGFLSAVDALSEKRDAR